MNQPQQPPQPPQQPSPVPQQPMGGPPPLPGQAPVPGQGTPGWQAPGPGQSVPPGWQGAPGHPPYPAAGTGRPKSGSPVGAFFLGLLVSFVIAALYTAVNAFTLTDQTRTVANTLYIGHGLLNGAVVGWLVGLVGRGSTGAHVGGAVVATLGAFFGFTNSVPFAMGRDGGFHAVRNMLEYTPAFPVEFWWGADALGHVLALVGLFAAAGAAWGVAHAVGRRREA